MRYDAVIFDLDGTLIDSERLFVEAGLAAFAALGHPVEADILHLTVGVAEAESRRRLGERLGPAFDFAAYDALWRRGVAAAWDAGLPLRPGVDAVLAELAARGTRRAVATNTFRDNALRKLDRGGVGGYFDPRHVVGADQVAAPKPAPDVFLAAAGRLGVDPARCLAVEDSMPGATAALAAGMAVLHVPDMVPLVHPRATFSAATLLEWVALAGLF